MKIIETHPREKGFVLWGHCQNILDDPRRFRSRKHSADLIWLCCVGLNWSYNGQGSDGYILRDFKNAPFYILCLYHMIDLKMFSLSSFILLQNGP